MNSRYERYNSDEIDNNTISRTKKNQDIYESLKDSDFYNIKTNNNIKIIDDSPKEINVEKIKKYILSINEEPPRKRTDLNIEQTITPIEEPKPKENKIYDINSVLEKARQSREQDYEKERYKKLRDTQYDILQKIKIYDSEEKPKRLEEEFNTEERTLIDLINTVTMQKNELLSELQGGKEEERTKGIEEEVNSGELKEEIEKQITSEVPKITEITSGINKENIDKSFYTNPMSFSKNDFEVFDELEKTAKKNNFFVKFIIFLLILVGLTTIAIVLKFVFNIGLF